MTNATKLAVFAICLFPFSSSPSVSFTKIGILTRGFMMAKNAIKTVIENAQILSISGIRFVKPQPVSEHVNLFLLIVYALQQMVDGFNAFKVYAQFGVKTDKLFELAELICIDVTRFLNVGNPDQSGLV